MDTNNSEPPRKIAPEQVEIVGMENTTQPSRKSGNPFDGTPFAFKNMKVITGGPMIFLLPLLLPLILFLMLILFVPLMLFGKTFIVRRK